MRSLIKSLLLALLVVLVTDVRDSRAQNHAEPQAAISDAEIDSALEIVSHDPNLAEERTVRTLSFGKDADKPEKKSGVLKWIGELFAWLAGTVRWLFWIVIGLLLLALVGFVVRLLRATSRWQRDVKSWAPTHVQSLDIRPESLPNDIGAAALSLWEAGEQRACLSLLYRGLLSRLVHAHEMPIRDSSTEGDCLRLAAAQLSPERTAFVVRLVRVWQRFVYGAQVPDGDHVRALCREFSTTLDQANATAQPHASLAAGLA
ncbi:MAG: DUF4129 domain-containing protein [Pseudomonadales bacterium]|nr:DUF4129 domain-containing protein [Pseudomonadales bacterium]